MRFLLPIVFCLTLCSCGDSSPDDRDGDRHAFPVRPIKVVVPFSPGGGSDTFARAVQTAVRENELLPEPLVIVNRPGAGGSIGSRWVKDVAADGYTILFLHDAIITARHAGQAAYGPEAFEPVAATGELGAVIAVGPESEFSDFTSLMSAAAENPETISFAANLGAPSHFWALQLEKASPDSKARFRFVQSGGGALRFGDLKGGHVAVSAFSVAELLQFQSAGLKALAYLGQNRHPVLADIPTAKELGFDVTTGNLQSWWAPKGTPPDRIAVVAEALQKAMQSDSLKRRMDELQIEPNFLNAEQLGVEITRRDEEISKVATRKTLSLPNFPLAVAIIASLLAVWSLFRRQRRDTLDAGESGKPSRPFIAALMMFGVVAITVAFWQLGRLGIYAVAIFLITGAGILLRNRIGALHLIALLLTACALAFGTVKLFAGVLGVDL